MKAEELLTNPTALVQPRMRAHGSTLTQTHACTRALTCRRILCVHARTCAWGTLAHSHVWHAIYRLIAHVQTDVRKKIRESRGVAGGTCDMCSLTTECVLSL